VATLDDSKNPKSNRSLKIAELLERLQGLLSELPDRRLAALKERLEMQDLESVLRKAIRDSGLTHYAIAKAAEFSPVVLDRFVGGKTITLATASKIVGVLGYGLMKLDPEPIPEQPVKKPTAKRPAKKRS
jgi:hypothetical protein